MESFKLDKESKSSWSWKLDEHDLKNQVENYDKLKATESYRGIAALLILFSVGLTVLLGLSQSLGVSSDTIGYALIVYLPIAYFVYKGHKWAIIAIMILWTLEKGYQLSQGSGITAIIWWLIFMPYFYKAYKVELEKEKTHSNSAMSGTTKRFCPNCGKANLAGASFCESCGKKIT